MPILARNSSNIGNSILSSFINNGQETLASAGVGNSLLLEQAMEDAVAAGVGMDITTRTRMVPTLDDVRFSQIWWDSERPYRAQTRLWNGRSDGEFPRAYLLYNGEDEIFITDSTTLKEIEVVAYYQQNADSPVFEVARRTIFVRLWQMFMFPDYDFEWATDPRFLCSPRRASCSFLDSRWKIYSVPDQNNKKDIMAKEVLADCPETGVFYMKSTNYGGNYPSTCPEVKFIDVAYHPTNPYKIEIFIYLIGSEEFRDTKAEINWGDGTIQEITGYQNRRRHTYAKAGLYNVTVRIPNEENDGCCESQATLTEPVAIVGRPVRTGLLRIRQGDECERDIFTASWRIQGKVRRPIFYEIDWNDGTIDQWRTIGELDVSIPGYDWDERNVRSVTHKYNLPFNDANSWWTVNQNIKRIRMKAWNLDNYTEDGTFNPSEEFWFVRPHIHANPFIEHFIVTEDFTKPMTYEATFTVTGHIPITDVAGGSQGPTVHWMGSERPGFPATWLPSQSTTIGTKTRRSYKSVHTYTPEDDGQLYDVIVRAASGDSGTCELPLSVSSFPVVQYIHVSEKRAPDSIELILEVIPKGSLNVRATWIVHPGSTRLPIQYWLHWGDSDPNNPDNWITDEVEALTGTLEHTYTSCVPRTVTLRIRNQDGPQDQAAMAILLDRWSVLRTIIGGLNTQILTLQTELDPIQSLLLSLQEEWDNMSDEERASAYGQGVFEQIGILTLDVSTRQGIINGLIGQFNTANSEREDVEQQIKDVPATPIQITQSLVPGESPMYFGGPPSIENVRVDYRGKDVVVWFDVRNGASIPGLRVVWGDGQEENFHGLQSMATRQVSHRYADEGVYTIRLVAIGICGDSIVEREVTVDCLEPVITSFTTSIVDDDKIRIIASADSWTDEDLTISVDWGLGDEWEIINNPTITNTVTAVGTEYHIAINRISPSFANEDGNIHVVKIKVENVCGEVEAEKTVFVCNEPPIVNSFFITPASTNNGNLGVIARWNVSVDEANMLPGTENFVRIDWGLAEDIENCNNIIEIDGEERCIEVYDNLIQTANTIQKQYKRFGTHTITLEAISLPEDGEECIAGVIRTITLQCTAPQFTSVNFDSIGTNNVWSNTSPVIFGPVRATYSTSGQGGNTINRPVRINWYHGQDYPDITGSHPANGTALFTYNDPPMTNWFREYALDTTAGIPVLLSTAHSCGRWEELQDGTIVRGNTAVLSRRFLLKSRSRLDLRYIVRRVDGGLRRALQFDYWPDRQDPNVRYQYCRGDLRVLPGFPKGIICINNPLDLPLSPGSDFNNYQLTANTNIPIVPFNEFTFLHTGGNRIEFTLAGGLSPTFVFNMSSIVQPREGHVNDNEICFDISRHWGIIHTESTD